jgi:hypothetical protein
MVVRVQGTDTALRQKNGDDAPKEDCAIAQPFDKGTQA